MGFLKPLLTCLLGSCLATCLLSARASCGPPQSWPEAWLFCDDFEANAPLQAPGRYFEADGPRQGLRVVPGQGLNGSRALQATWQPGAMGAGSVKLAIGRNPNAAIARAAIAPGRTFRGLYYRFYLRHQQGWHGNPYKLARAMVFSNREGWGQAMIAHLWQGPGNTLALDPASCVRDNHPRCSVYNDFPQLRWLGMQPGKFALFAPENAVHWHCIEQEIRLNEPGMRNGAQRLWIDGRLDAAALDLDLVGTYTEYGINALFLENYWNGGAPARLSRYFDDLVVATHPIGCQR